MEFYTYLWLREDGTPYYVGKGKGRRGYKTDDHGVKCPKDNSRIIIQEWPSESDAFFAERFLIAFYGRRNLGTGLLRNLTNGGEGQSGVVWTKEQRKRLSESHKGLLRSDQHKKNLSLSHLGHMASNEARRNQSDAAKRRALTPEGRANSSKAGILGAIARWGKK